MTAIRVLKELPKHAEEYEGLYETDCHKYRGITRLQEYKDNVVNPVENELGQLKNCYVAFPPEVWLKS